MPSTSARRQKSEMLTCNECVQFLVLTVFCVATDHMVIFPLEFFCSDFPCLHSPVTACNAFWSRVLVFIAFSAAHLECWSLIGGRLMTIAIAIVQRYYQ